MAQALWHLSAENSTIKEIPFSSRNSFDCEVKSLYSLISTGTERLVASGKVPPALQMEMRVPYMKGSFGFPLTYGYSMVGRVQTAGHPLEGELVHLLHPHQDNCNVLSDSLTKVPEQLSPKVATLASNMETAITAVWDSEVTLGDRVLLVGFGIIGALIATIIQDIGGVDLVIAEINPDRKAIAQSLGFNVLENQSRGQFDLAFHCSASQEGLQHCIEATAIEATIVELSWYGTRSINIQLGKSFHVGRKRLISSQVSRIPAKKTQRWNSRRRKALVWELLLSGRFDGLITSEIPFAESPEFFESLRNSNPPGLGYCIKY